MHWDRCNPIVLEMAANSDQVFDLYNLPREMFFEVCKHLDFQTLWALAQSCRGFLDLVWGRFVDGELVRGKSSYLGKFERLWMKLFPTWLAAPTSGTIQVCEGAYIGVTTMPESLIGTYSMKKIMFYPSLASRNSSVCADITFESALGAQIIYGCTWRTHMRFRESEGADDYRFEGVYPYQGTLKSRFDVTRDELYAFGWFEAYAARAGLDWSPGDPIPPPTKTSEETYQSGREYIRKVWETFRKEPLRVHRDMRGIKFSQEFHDCAPLICVRHVQSE